MMCSSDCSARDSRCFSLVVVCDHHGSGNNTCDNGEDEDYGKSARTK